MKKTSFIPAAILIVQVIVHSGCKSKDHPDGGPTITTDKTVELANKQVEDNGILYIDKPGDSLSGLLMYVSDAAFATSRRFRISYAPITHHELGPGFNPISPLITISCGGGFSDSVVTMEIPVHLPEGHFAMGFLYDEKTGKLEGMPLLKLEKDRVVIALRNFSHSSTREGSPVAAQVAGGAAVPVTRFAISAIDEKSLQAGFDSGFKPGQDDMPNLNCGTFLNRSGICDGQSQAMLWYYDTRRMKGATPLFKLLDNDGGTPTPHCGLDDTKAIKFASALQTETKGYLLPLYSLLQLYNQQMGSLLGDIVTLRAFAYTIMLTKEPQYVVISPAEEGASHAMVIYKVKENALYVADPNFPGDAERRIVYDTEKGQFKPYSSKVNTESPGKDFTSFFYYGKSALYAYQHAADHWKKVEDGTIGKETFPEFIVQVRETKDGQSQWVTVEDGYRFTDEEERGLYLLTKSSGFGSRTIFCDTAGNILPETGGGINVEKKGEQLIGVCMYDDDLLGRWAGFKWVRIYMAGDEDLRPSQNIKPAHGDLTVNIKVNDMSFELENCNFSIAGNSFVMDGPARSITHQFTIRTDSFHGEGKYNDVAGYWASNQDNEPSGTYFNPKKDGKITITKWGRGKLEGVFSFDAYDDYYKKNVSVSGYFTYKRPEQ